MNNNKFMLETGELIKHYDKQVAREREKFIKELEEKYKSNTQLIFLITSNDSRSCIGFLGN